MTLQIDERPCDENLEDDIYEVPDLENDEVCINSPSCHDDMFPSLFYDDQFIHYDY